MRAICRQSKRLWPWVELECVACHQGFFQHERIYEPVEVKNGSKGLYNNQGRGILMKEAKSVTTSERLDAAVAYTHIFLSR